MNLNEYSFEINLDDYTRIREIGSGAFGVVYLIKKKKDLKTYAAKVLLQSSTPNNRQEKIKSFRSEVRVHERLEHPCILHLYGHCDHDFENKPNPTIIIDYASEESLHSKLAQQRYSKIIQLDDTQKYIILYGIAKGMEYLHQNGIIHQDLKPENILLNIFFYPIIADFGLARLSQSEVFEQSDRVGTCRYMPPESFQSNSKKTTPKNDVYSYALIAYELVTGQFPYKNLSPPQIITFVDRGGRPAFPEKGIDIEMQKLIEECWDQNPNSRPNFSQILERLDNNELIKKMNVDIKRFEKYKEIIKLSRKDFDQNVSNNFMSYDDIANSHMENSISLYPILEFNNLNQECKKLVIKAEESSPSDLYKLAHCLIYKECGFPRNVELAFQYLDIAEEFNFYRASELKGKILYEGKLVPKDIKKAKKSFQLIPLSERKSNESILIMTKIELEEKKPNYRKVMEDLNFLSRHYGVIESKVLLGKLYMQENEEETLKRDLKKAFHYFELAAKEGDAEGLAYYGLFYYYGYGVVSFDFKIASESFYESYEKGSQTGAAFYAECLARGRGVEKNEKEAVKIAKHSAEEGNNKGKNIYGLFLNQGVGGLEIDKKKSCCLWKESAEEGDAYGEFLYGNCLIEGSKYGVKEDINEAISMYKKSILGGCQTAMATLGQMLMQEQFFDLYFSENYKDFKSSVSEGFQLIQYAADGGDDFAIVLLSHILANGIGVSRDLDAAEMILETGVRRGIADCCTILADLASKNELKDKGQEESDMYRKKASLLEYGNVIVDDEEDVENICINGCWIM